MCVWVTSAHLSTLALGYEKASHHLPRADEAPNSVTSELITLGFTRYELVLERTELPFGGGATRTMCGAGWGFLR
ncbi:hypothetical protein BDV28DRAFT_141465 [Aspergillus coremiiformis]|uniref:Uncharacterized protein n=1 Tax=Aspergillus coremiiformis TaxID=138285 RepID=A0A5N6YY36_9EURO|nr:hypothetical protein BDV28DRAFT_141465 [Aspergillus coremiiformis]